MIKNISITLFLFFLMAVFCYGENEVKGLSPLASENTYDTVFQGLNDQVYALTIYEGMLIVGGEFDSAGGKQVNRIACWDSSTWSPLGMGVDEYRVKALCVYGDSLIAGGWFTGAGGVSVDHIAAWYGSSWSPLGDGAVSTVSSLCTFDGNLYASGPFLWPEPDQIALWNGSTWDSLGSSVEDDVNVLCVFDNKLIVGGDFDTAGGVAASNIAAWDGSSWSALGSGIGEYFVKALCVYDSKLIVGGYFSEAGGITANNIAVWDGSNWSTLGEGANGFVYALAVYDGKLYAGGYRRVFPQCKNFNKLFRYFLDGFFGLLSGYIPGTPPQLIQLRISFICSRIFLQDADASSGYVKPGIIGVFDNDKIIDLALYFHL